jgi:serine/threonine protein kinase
MTERTIFLTALEKNATERTAYLNEACGADVGLRQRVEGLLRSHGEAGNFLDIPALAQIAPPEAEQGPSRDTVADELARQGKAPALAFLEPALKPDSLGRLGHYEILEVIGQGGFGTVLRAFDEKLHRVVAIKVLAPALATNGTACRRFVREAQAAAAIKNDHVIAIHNVEDEHQPPYLVMELIDGISLQERLDRQGPVADLREILRIGMQTAEGLAAAHKQGLVHRDIKPANILLENGVQRVKITDFGLARAVDDASLSQSGVVAGTPQYMSPEQADGLPVDHRSDLFSLGSVLYALCTGRAPFRASGTMAVLRRVCEETPRPIREINPDIPEWLVAIINKLHAKKPADRFQSAREVAELLSRHLAHVQQPTLVPRPADVAVTNPVTVADGEGIKPARPLRPSLAVAILAICIPIIAIPLVHAANIFLSPGFGPIGDFPLLLLGMLAAGSILAGLALLLVRFVEWLQHLFAPQPAIRRPWRRFVLMMALLGLYCAPKTGPPKAVS